MAANPSETFNLWHEAGLVTYGRRVNGLDEDPLCIANRERFKAEFASQLAADWIAWRATKRGEHPYQIFAKHLRNVLAGGTSIDKSCPKNTPITEFVLNVADRNSEEHSWATYFDSVTGIVSITAADLHIADGTLTQANQYPDLSDAHRLIALNQMVGDLTHELFHSINVLNVSSISNPTYSTRAEIVSVATNLYYSDVLSLQAPGLQVYGLDCPDATQTILALNEWEHVLKRADETSTVLQQMRAYAGKAYANANMLCLTSNDINNFYNQSENQPSKKILDEVMACWK